MFILNDLNDYESVKLSSKKNLFELERLRTNVLGFETF
jgi:hypothetical protein